jgi:AcrR family transcriptional regulator
LAPWIARPRKECRLPNKKIEGRETAVARLVGLFFELGFDGTTLKHIEERTGLGRASLYNYFPGGKIEMARAVLVASDQWSVDYLMREFDDTARPPGERLGRMLGNLDGLHTRPEQLTPANAFGIGAAAEQYTAHLRDHLHGLVELMRDLMVACGIPATVATRRAWEFRVAWEGALVCTRVLGEQSLYRDLMRHMPAYLLADPAANGFLPADFTPPAVR